MQNGMALFGDEATCWRWTNTVLCRCRESSAFCKCGEVDACRNLAERFILGTNAAADRIDADAPVTKETNMTKVARANNEGITEARLLRAFWDWRLMSLSPLRFYYAFRFGILDVCCRAVPRRWQLPPMGWVVAYHLRREK